MAISLVRVDLSPNLHVMSLHRQHGQHPLFVLREFDVKVLRHTAHRKKQDDEGNQHDEKHSSSPPRRHRVVCGESQFMATGPSEQALRVSIRAAVLRLGLTMEAATAHEIKLLKEADVLGKRAPSASLLTGPDMCHLLRAFGVHNIATKLARQLETLQPGVMIPCHEDTDVGSRRVKHDAAGDEEVVKKLRAKKEKEIRVKNEQSPSQVKRKLESQPPPKHASTSSSSSSSFSSSSHPSPHKRPRSFSHTSSAETNGDILNKDEQAAGRHVFQCPPSSQHFDSSPISTSGSVPTPGHQSHPSLPSSYTPPTFPQFTSPYPTPSPSHPHPVTHPFPPGHGYQTTHPPMGQSTSTHAHAAYEHQHHQHQHQHHQHNTHHLSTHDSSPLYAGGSHESQYATYTQPSQHSQQSHQSQSHQQHAQHTQQHTTPFSIQQHRQIANYEPVPTQQQHNNNHHTTITRPPAPIKQMGYSSTSQLMPSSHATTTTHLTPASNIPPPSHPHNPPPPLTTRIQPINIPPHIPSHVMDSLPVPSPTFLASPNPNFHPSISTQHLASLRAFSAHPFHKRDTNMCIDMSADLGDLQFPPLCDTQELKIRADISSLAPQEPYFSEESSPDMDTDTGMESLDNINLDHELDTQSYHQIVETNKDCPPLLELPNPMWNMSRNKEHMMKIARQTSGNCQTEWHTLKHHGHHHMSTYVT